MIKKVSRSIIFFFVLFHVNQDFQRRGALSMNQYWQKRFFFLTKNSFECQNINDEKAVVIDR